MSEYKFRCSRCQQAVTVESTCRANALERLHCDGWGSTSQFNMAHHICPTCFRYSKAYEPGVPFRRWFAHVNEALGLIHTGQLGYGLPNV